MKPAQQGECWRAGMAKSHSLCNPSAALPPHSPVLGQQREAWGLPWFLDMLQGRACRWDNILFLFWSKGGTETRALPLLSTAHGVLLLWRTQIWARTKPKMPLKFVIYNQKHLRHKWCFGCQADWASRMRLSSPVHHRYTHWKFPVSSICLLSGQLDLSCWKTKVQE